MADYLLACRAAAGSNGELSWCDDDFLLAQNIRQWVELPLWRPQPGTWAMNTERAEAAGMETRPIAHSVADTAAWLAAEGPDLDHPRAGKLGLAPDRERAILAAWDATAGQPGAEVHTSPQWSAER